MNTTEKSEMIAEFMGYKSYATNKGRDYRIPEHEEEVITENASPNPEYLIKSIAEQGYSLETSLADLMDNSISANANKIEVIDMKTFTIVSTIGAGKIPDALAFVE